jgi:hypothetical protein
LSKRAAKQRTIRTRDFTGDSLVLLPWVIGDVCLAAD